VASQPLPPDLDTLPVKDTLDNQDGTLSGGSFAVVFGSSSVPMITELTGTMFAIGLVEPIIMRVDGPVDPFPVGTTTSWTVDFSARGEATDQAVAFSWGDGSASSTVVVPSAAGMAQATHVYDASGVYLVEVSVTDSFGLESEVYEFRYVVVFDPDGGTGFVTGGGWIHSRPGSFHPDLAELASIEGKATFGFVSKYKRGASVPTGNTEFQFEAGGVSFASTRYQWLVVAGARAQYKGWGTINGAPETYAFMLTSQDGAMVNGGSDENPDRFRIKIWDEASGTTIYDNQHGTTDNGELGDSTVIGGGNIVIHNPPPSTRK
jgi:hypothetical protein